MTKFTFDANIFSDLHKDAYGFRPRGHRFYAPDTTDEERQQMWDYTLADLERTLDQEKREQAANLAKVEKMIEENLAFGAADRAQAIKWLVETLNPSLTDLMYGGEWVCWELGLSFYEASMFEAACKELYEKMEKQNA